MHGFGGNKWNMHDMDEDDFDDDGEEYYDEDEAQYYYENPNIGMHGIDASGGSGEYDDEDGSDESGILRQQYIQQQLAAQAAAVGKKPGGFGAAQKQGGFMSGAGGTQFGAMSGGLGGKSNSLYGGAGAAGVGASKPASGGFMYGAASAGGSLFGAASAAGGSTFASGLGSVGSMGGIGGGGTTFGASKPGTAPTSQSAGGFAFGQASQFGGIGSATGAGGLFGGSAAAAAPSDDPYNIPIDLTKIKRAEKPVKTFEEKTSEEKIKTMQQLSKEIEASGAKSIIKKPGESKKKSTNVSFGQCLTYEYDKDPLNNQTAEFIESKDISDMRDEKTKMRDLLQEQENKQLAEYKRIQELMNKQNEKSSLEGGNKFQSSASPADKVEDSIGESASLSASHEKNRKDKPTESYDTDTFEDQSNSLSKEGSAKKGQLNYWPGKGKEDSVSISQSKDQSESNQGVFSANAMEEYLKKQEAQKKAQAGTKQPEKKAVAASKDFSESSDKYTDEDFDSMSKSQSALAGLPKVSSSRAAAAPSGPEPVGRIYNTYVKKHNQFVQTDESRYNFSSGPDARQSDNYLQRELRDAEDIIQQQKSDQAEVKTDLAELQLEIKKSKMDKDQYRKEALNANATNERLKEQLKDQMHKINLYKIETEELIKQIDMADAKTRQKEDDLVLLQAEYDRKLSLQEKQIQFRRAKNEDREIYELKREHGIKMEELRTKLDEAEADMDYYKTKTEKLEAEVDQVRMGKGDNKKIRELENEVELLRVQLEDSQKNGGASMSLQTNNMDLRNIKKQLTPDEQMQLQREIIQLDLMLKGYESENQKLMRQQKAHESQSKDLLQKLQHEQSQVKEFKLKALKERSGVFVEEDDKDVPIMAKNVMGEGAISREQLEELKQTIVQLQESKTQARKDLALQADQFRAQISKLREAKAESEKQMYDMEFILGEKDQANQKENEDAKKQIVYLNEQVDELQAKVAWFRENQQLLNENEKEEKSNHKELNEAKLQLQRAKEDKKRINELEKKCRLLEETAKAKNPNSIGMLIQAAKTDVVRDGDSESKKELEMKVGQLTYELEVQEKEFEKKLRAMRQEQERIKQNYESRAGQSPEAKQVRQLEEELQKTKTYYNKRIREIEDKYKYGMGKAPKPEPAPKSNRSEKSVANNQNEINSLKEQIDRVMKERNHLAQKVFEFEQKNQQQRRASFSGSQIGSPEKEAITSSPSPDMKNLFYQGQQDQEEVQRPKTEPQLNPFSLEAQNQPTTQRSIPEILDIFSKVNLSIFGPQMKIPDLFKTLSNELGVKISVNDLKKLNKFLQNRENEDLEFLGKDENIVDMNALKAVLPTKGGDNSEKVEQLQNEIRRLKQNINTEDEFTMHKQAKFQREILAVENEKRDLMQKVSKLEQQKGRLEQVFKSAMKGGNMDLIDEVQMLVRRIEFLEEQSEKRSKSQYLENQEPYVREIEMLKSKLMQEREMRDQIVQKKNAEVSYFKAELDALLSEMQNHFKKKQASRVK